MNMIAQTGMGGAAGGLAVIAILLWMLFVFGVPILLFMWFLPEMFELLCDTVRGRDVLVEYEQERQLEGRILDPQYKALVLSQGLFSESKLPARQRFTGSTTA